MEALEAGKSAIYFLAVTFGRWKQLVRWMPLIGDGSYQAAAAALHHSLSSAERPRKIHMTYADAGHKIRH